MIDIDKKTVCRKCDAWDPMNEKAGLCRRNAPVPGSGSSEVVRFPVTRGDEFCYSGLPAQDVEIPATPTVRKKSSKSKSSK